jgi:hypothetical protein
VTALSAPSSSDGEEADSDQHSVFIPFFGTIPETVTTTTEANFDLHLFDRRLFSFTLTPVYDHRGQQDAMT